MRSQWLSTHLGFMAVVAAVLTLCGGYARAQTSTTFTYQGQLAEGGVAANGTYDLRFSVLDTQSGGGNVLSATVCRDHVRVIDGLMTVDVDFGVGAWLSATNAFLQVEVRADATVGNCATGTYTALTPRSRFTAAPRSASTRGITVSQDGKVGLGGANPDRGLTMLGGINVRDSASQGVYLLTNEVVFANAQNEDEVYRYDAPPLDRHTFFAGASPALSIDSIGRIGVGLETPEAPVHARSRINQGNFVWLQGSRQISNQATPNGPRTAAALSVGNVHGPWTSADSARVPDGVNATSTPSLVNTSVGYQTATLTLSGFGFAIPANRSIVGIGVEVVSSNTIAYSCASSVTTMAVVRPSSGSTLGSTTIQNVPVQAASQVTVGGSGQLFGATWTPELINSPNFSIDVILRSACSEIAQSPLGDVALPCACAPTGQFRLDGLRVTIYTSTLAPFTESFGWTMGYGPGQSTLSIAPTPDLSNSILNMTTDGRVGVGVVPNASTPLTTRFQVAGNVQCLSLIETSTTRFKTDVSALRNPLESVLALQPVRFRWDAAHGGRDDIGFLAEQVQAIAPALVTTDQSGEAAGMNYGRIGVLTVGAIQQLKDQHDQLVAENADLKARMLQLEQRLNAMGEREKVQSDKAIKR